jgi:hypothetical protein
MEVRVEDYTRDGLAIAGHIALCWNQMRIDPNGTIGGSPALAVRKTLRYLRGWDQWKVSDLEAVAALAPGTGEALVKALRTEGLIEASGAGAWTVTQAGRTFSAPTAARPVTRLTAEKALAEFLERVTQVNEDPYFLAKARLKNRQRAEELADQGRRFRNFLESEGCWYFEAFRYLKGGSRVISLADYRVEKTFVLAAPHRFIIGEAEQIAAPTIPQPAPRQRRPRGCPF